jgi:hypothetical protein
MTFRKDLLIERLREIYPTYNSLTADHKKAFVKIAHCTKKKPAYKMVWLEIIARIQKEFPQTYTEDRTIPDIYDPGMRMHFYDDNRSLKLVFIKSMLADVIGVYAIDLAAHPSFDSVDTDYNLQEMLDSNQQLLIYHRRICQIILEYFPDHSIFPSTADKLLIDDIVAPLSGDGGVGKPVKLFYLLFGDNIW